MTDRAAGPRDAEPIDIAFPLDATIKFSARGLKDLGRATERAARANWRGKVVGYSRDRTCVRVRSLTSKTVSSYARVFMEIAEDAALASRSPSGEATAPTSETLKLLEEAEATLRQEAVTVAYCSRCDQRAAWKGDEDKAVMIATADGLRALASSLRLAAAPSVAAPLREPRPKDLCVCGHAHWRHLLGACSQCLSVALCSGFVPAVTVREAMRADDSAVEPTEDATEGRRTESESGVQQSEGYGCSREQIPHTSDQALFSRPGNSTAAEFRALLALASADALAAPDDTPAPGEVLQQGLPFNAVDIWNAYDAGARETREALHRGPIDDPSFDALVSRSCDAYTKLVHAQRPRAAAELLAERAPLREPGSDITGAVGALFTCTACDFWSNDQDAAAMHVGQTWHVVEGYNPRRDEPTGAGSDPDQRVRPESAD